MLRLLFWYNGISNWKGGDGMIKLTSYSKSAGWAAKIGPETLAQVLCDLPKFESDLLLVGFETSDDAAVYKINEEQAVIQTLDFFTPIVDNPYDFGAIAAANALSDVYAMGGIPTLALSGKDNDKLSSLCTESIKILDIGNTLELFSLTSAIAAQYVLDIFVSMSVIKNYEEILKISAETKLSLDQLRNR